MRENVSRVRRDAVRDLPKDDEVKPDSLFYDSGSFALRRQSMEWAKETGRDWREFYDTDDFFTYLDRYAEFIFAHKDVIDIYANIDAIPDPDISWRNLQLLKHKGLDPLPVIHLGTSMKWVRRHLNQGYKFIGLGGLVSSGGFGSKHSARSWLDQVFEILCDTPDRTPMVRTHGFGLTGPMAWLYPWWSVDSTSYIRAGAFGIIKVPNKRRKEWHFLSSPKSIFVSPEGMAAESSKDGDHIDKLYPNERQQMLDWLLFIGVPLGKTGNEGEIIEEGVINTRRLRILANLRYFDLWAKSIPPYPQPWRSKRGGGFGL